MCIISSYLRRLSCIPVRYQGLEVLTFRAYAYSRRSRGNHIPGFLKSSSDCNNYKRFIENKMASQDIPRTLKVYRNGSSTPDDQTVDITITQQEQELFKLLTDCVNHCSLNTGGWVRDKLLCNESKDIDITLPKMTGVEFCEHLNKYTKEKFDFVRTIGIVKRCPDQSKHLETATMSILGFDVDFVNLRAEDYASSRIPSMRIGTPMEDALRRDFTVNSLFYNITKDIIEDYTGFGIEDLKNKIIRTCSNVTETFLDDPLRIIRAIRFTARLNFKLNDDILNTITNKEVLIALRDKVSRSRISQELDIILSKGDTAHAFSLLSKFHVLSLLLGVGIEHVSKSDELTTRFCLDAALIEDGCTIMHKVQDLTVWNAIERKYLYLGAFTSAMRDLKNVGKVSIYDYVIKDRLKLPNKYASRNQKDSFIWHDSSILFSATIISEGSRLFSSVIYDLPNSRPELRLKLGLVIRSIGPLWKESLLLCLAELGYDSDRYYEIIAKAEELDLSNCYELKAKITGNELLKILPKLTQGLGFKKALDKQVEMQLYNERVTENELITMLKNTFPQYL